MAQKFEFFPIQLHPDMDRRSLYMLPPFATPVEDGLLVARDAPLIVDGAMNSLYDRELHPFVGGKQLALRVQAQGACRVSLIHRSAGGEDSEFGSFISPAVIRKHSGDGADGTIHFLELDFRLMNSEQSFGRWFFKFEAVHADAKLINASWIVRDADLHPLTPAFVICTFKREAQVAANVRRLTRVLDAMFANEPPREQASASAQPNPYRIYVVDNAQSLSCDVLDGAHVQLIPQRNVGGAGGFGRGIYEAMADGRFTHVAMLDDDADVDDVSIIRMMNLLRLTQDPDLFVGGLQFDTYSPCKLADAGAYWTPERFEQPIPRLEPCDISTADGRDGLAHTYTSNFNGWWLFGGRLESFRKFGMPLPCFVHLDDVEYGVRIQLNGGRTVTVPGIAVWHEPFYAKVEGWFAYYNIRNELIRMSAQTPLVFSQLTNWSSDLIERRSKERVVGVAKKLRRRFRDLVNSYQYGSAALLAKAVEDFAHGPAILSQADAEAVHTEVMATYKEANVNYRMSRSMPPGFVGVQPRRGKKLFRLAQIYSRNGNRLRVPGKQDINRVTMFPSRREINWKFIRPRQAWGYPDPGLSMYHIYRFDREAYAAVDAKFRSAIKTFELNARGAQADWARVYPELTSEAFWSRIVATL